MNVRVKTFFTLVAVVAIGALWSASGGGSALTAQVPSQRQMTKDDIEKMMTELSNWGRWGKDDQLGTMNLITPAKRKQAAALVHEGYSVSLARDIEMEKAEDVTNPFGHEMLRSGADNDRSSMDRYTVAYHGYAHTHLDSLCHIFWNGKMYNGFSKDEVTQKGAGKLSIANLKGGILTRGILIDIPKLKGVDYLEPGQAIYAEDLDAWEKQAKVKVGPGDIIFVRTGRWARRAAKGPWDVARNSAGLHPSVARWLRQRDVAAVGSDVASEVAPSGIEGAGNGIHQLAIVAMGVHLFDNCDLEAVAKAAA